MSPRSKAENQGLAEYMLLLALVAFVAIVDVGSLASSVSSAFTKVGALLGKYLSQRQRNLRGFTCGVERSALNESAREVTISILLGGVNDDSHDVDQSFGPFVA